MAILNTTYAELSPTRSVRIAELDDFDYEKVTNVDYLGAGVNGHVHRATYVLTGEEVALKTAWSKDSGVDHEADVLLMLEHHYIVQLLYRARHDIDKQFIALPLLEKIQGVPVQMRWRLLAHIAEAMDYIHGLGMLHRDPQPSNFMVQGEHAVLTDFGFACAVDSVESNITTGEPAYRAPEVEAGLGHSIASDNYSFARAAYYTIHGSFPPQNNVLAVLSKALARDPQARFTSCVEFMELFEAEAALQSPSHYI